ncbi:MAG: GAF domain-containing protein [Anaerolineales bacterium]
MKGPAPIKSTQLNQIIGLGSNLLDLDNLEAQRDLIASTLKRIFGGEVEVWLSDILLKLPGRSNWSPKLAEPPTEPMQEAMISRQMVTLEKPWQTLAFPIFSQKSIIGVIQLSRAENKPFNPVEIGYLDLIISHIGQALTISHRQEVEHWRIEQLNLVHEVSTQLVDIVDVDELTSQVAKLIQKTFDYYYVSIFTLTPSGDKLSFRSSAGGVGKKRRKRKPFTISVDVGQGLIGTVAQQGHEIICNDVHNEPRFKFYANLPETQSEIVLPLKIEDKVLGVLDVQSDSLNAFHPNDVIVLRALAANISIAIESTYLYCDLENRTRHLSLVTEVSRDINSILDLDKLLQSVANLIYERLGYPHINLFSVHPNRRRIYHEAGYGPRVEALEGYSLDLDSSVGLIPWAATHGETLVVNDVSVEPRYVKSPLPPENTMAEMVVPLKFNNEVLGVLDIQAEKKDAFSKEDRQVCESLADNIAIAMHNADLYRTERWRRQISDSMREVTGLLSANASVDDVLDLILIELEKSLSCEISAIWLLDGEDIFLAHIRGADPIEVEMARDVWPESASFLADALNSDTPIIRKPFDPIGPSGAAHGYSADYSAIAARLQIGDNPLGVLSLANPEPGKYGHEAQSITMTFAGYAAVAIENARLFDAAQEQAYASAALLQVAQSVATAESLDELLGSIARMTPILVGVESCVIFLYHGESFVISQSYGMTDEHHEMIIGRIFQHGDFSLIDQVLSTNEMVVGSINSSAPDSWLKPELAESKEDLFYAMELGEHLLIGFPLSIKSDFFGVMMIEETSDVRRFRQKRVEIIKGIAQQLAMSIQNEQYQLETSARERLEYEFNLARQIQQTFLPEKMPQLENWELAAYWKPARQVGGDFYDLFKLPNGEMGLVIADVSDKGIPAALFMAVTRTLLRAVIIDETSPARVLQRINALLIPENEQGMFVTTVFAVLSLEKNDLIYANAGHNPPFLINSGSGEIKKLTRTGMALGIQQDIEIQEQVIHLDKDDCVLLYTDGLTEAASLEGDLFGDERLEKLISEKRCMSPEDMLASIEEEVFNFMETNILSDDLTMMLIKRLK